MRVVHVVESVSLDFGGPSRSVPGLCRGLDGQGIDVTLASCRNTDRVPDGLTCRFWLPVGGKYWTVRREVAREIAVLRPDVVHTHGLWLQGCHVATVAAGRQNIPLVTAPRGMLEPWSLGQRAWKKRLALLLFQRRDLRWARCLHATAISEAAQFRCLGFRQPVIVCPNGVDVPEQLAPTAGMLGVRHERRALFLSRIHPKKGLLALVEAWSRVRPKGWIVEIAGIDEDGHQAVVQAAVRKAGLEQQVRFAGPMDGASKWAAYRRADLFVLPSFSENFGIVVAEALAAGLPVITTRGTPWHELETQRCGWWIDTNAEALADALREAILCSDEERMAMGQRGQKLVSEKYLWPAVAAQMATAYQWLLHGGPTPPFVQIN